MSAIDRLLDIVARLRDPQGGCPWDVEQSFETIAPLTIEEAYEVDDAVRRRDFDALRGELGDLLLHVVFHAQMAREERRFAFDDVVHQLCDKLVRRHPHVFGDAEIATAREQIEAWEKQKAEERARAGQRSLADDVPLALPALLRARKLLSRAQRAGFPGPDPERAADAVAEALARLRAARAGGERAALEKALGALLLAAARLGQRLELEPEDALRAATAALEAELREAEREHGG